MIYKKLLLLLFLLCTAIVHAQYKFEYAIDTTTLERAEKLYITDLQIEELPQTDQIQLKWEANKYLKYYMVEIRDPESDELLYRQQHREKSATLPAGKLYSVYPVTKSFQGVPVTISLEEAQKNGFEPKNTTRNLEIKKKRALRDREEKERSKKIEEARKQEEERLNFWYNFKGILIFIATAIVAAMIVFFVWLIKRQSKKPVQADMYHPKINREYDQDFENLK